MRPRWFARRSLYLDRSGLVHWRVVSSNGRAIAHSPQGFADEFDAAAAFDWVRRELAHSPMSIHHSDRSRSWVWVVTDSRGRWVASASRSYERYGTCKLAYARFVDMVDDCVEVNDFREQ